MKIRAYLPKIYDFLPPFFDSEIEETEANCSECNNPESSDYVYPYKCCTFYPNIPNYLVGGILQSSNKKAKEIIQKRIEERHSVNPYGIYKPKKLALIYNQANKEQVFGKSEQLLCPYYSINNKGLCSIWKHRSNKCSTYYCRYNQGISGNEFWDTLKKYLKHIEESLSEYAVYKVFGSGNYPKIKSEYDPDNELSLVDIDEEMKDAEYEKVWLSYHGEEALFYKKAFHIVKELTAQKLSHILGIKGKTLLENCKHAYKGLTQPDIPEKLKFNPKCSYIYQEGTDSVEIRTPNDGFFNVNKKLFFILQLFDGERTIEECNIVAREEYLMELEYDLIVSFYQNILLV